MATSAIPIHAPQQRIAPIWHTIGLLFLVSLPIVRGIYQQAHGNPDSQIFASHAQVFLRFYVPVLIFEWALALYVFWGVRRNGGLRQLIGGRWSRATDVLRDLGLGVAFLFGGILCISIVIHLLGPGHSKSISTILPQGPKEMAVWILISLTAGFVEELVYRGYLQQQFTSLGMPLALAALLQAVIFGAGHAYEGVSRAVAITVFGAFAGAVVAWRRSLRPNMIGHALMDVLAALLRTA